MTKKFFLPSSRNIIFGILAGIILISLALALSQRPLSTISKNPTTLSSTSSAPSAQANQQVATNAPAKEPVVNADTQIGQQGDLQQAPAVAPAGCSLQFVFNPQNKTVDPGDQITYEATMTNVGKSSCVNPSFSLYYADNESFVSATPKATASNYWWDLPTLGPGKSYSVAIVTTENLSSDEPTVANEGCATADNGKDACADNAIFINGNTAETANVTPPAALSSPSSIGSPLASKEFGIWVWDSPEVMTPSYEQNVVQTMQLYGLNTVYVTIDDYLPVVSETGSKKTADTQTYEKALNTFVSLAQSKHIAVVVEGGSSDWGESANQWKGLALINFVKMYNAAYPNAQVAGFQYDVESYLLPQYATDEADVLSDYVSLIDQSAAALVGTNIKFEVVIPHFFDDQIAWTTPFNYKGKVAYAYNHLLDVLAQKPGSEMVVMAYRNTTDGPNGSIALSQTEVAEANNTQTRVIIAQETGDVDPSYVTFHGETKEDLFNALDTLSQTFARYASFGGTAIHYIDPFLVLK